MWIACRLPWQPSPIISARQFRGAADKDTLRWQFVRSTVAGPAAWNSLPVYIRNIGSHSAFCRQLKSYLFAAPWLNYIINANDYHKLFIFLFILCFFIIVYFALWGAPEHWLRVAIASLDDDDDDDDDTFYDEESETKQQHN